MARVLMKGCEAIAEAAVRAGCRFFAGYPITPQNEIPEYFARRLPEVGGVFVQGESEIASVNMVYGSGQTGTRCMSSSSSTGISLYSEGISFCASARIPIVYANVMRGGPGIGSIQPSQQDYLQAAKASGNGGVQMRGFAPSTGQEGTDMTYRAFDYADEDRNPVLILADGVIGTMMEPVELPPMLSNERIAEIKASKRSWACVGHKPGVEPLSWIEPGCFNTDRLQARNIEAEELYRSWKPEWEEYRLEGAQIVLTAYGISGRIAKAVVDELCANGVAAGLIRPVTVNPFPYEAFEHINYSICKGILDIEMAIPALMIHDVRIGVKERTEIRTCLCSGGNIMRKKDVLEAARQLLEDR